MVSTMQAPPPVPPMRPPRPPRSVAGPLVLIVMGVIFLLHFTFGVLPFYSWGRLFARFWPALLILWGIVKIIEYQQANRTGVRPPGIGAGGVFLVLILVVGGLAASEFYRWNWQGWQQWCEGSDAENLPWCGHSYSYTDELQQAFPAGANLHVTSERGAINITASEDNQLHVNVHKRVRGDRQEQADNWNRTTRPQINALGQTVTLDANTRGAGDHWVSTDLDISLPRKASVTVSTRHGDISIMGRDGPAQVTSQDGDVAVTDLNGTLTLNLDKSSARISQISSDVSIQGRANDISLEDVKGAVRLDGDFMESVKLSRIAKPVTFKSSRTDMDYSKVQGYLNLDSGDLEATSISGPLRLRTRSKDILLNGVTSDVHLEDENGAVEIHMNKIGSMDVSNRKGDIRIYVPEKSGFQVDAQARDGEIHTDFNSLKVENGDSRATASGSVNGGGPHMVINEEHGTIEIRSGAIIPTPPAPAMPKTPKAPNARSTPELPDTSEN